MIAGNDTVSTNNYTVASFFGGVGGIDLGFKQAKKFSTVYINEFDKYAQETITMNFPTVYLDKRDIHEVDADDVPHTDVIVGGFPCQAFSIAGYRKGFEDERGDLFFELLRIIKHQEPKAIFIENVKNMVTHDHGNTFKVIREALTINGYYIKWKVMNGKEYGNVPQNRERIYIVGFRNRASFDGFKFPDEIELSNGLSTVIDFDSRVDEKYYYRKGVQPFYDKLEEDIKSQESIYQWRRQYVRENKSGVVPTLTANMGTGGHNVPLVLTEHGIRKLTPEETFKVQGFPKEFKLPEIANSHLYKQAGNSVIVPLIKRIAEKIAKVLEHTHDTIQEESYDNAHILIYVNMKNRFEGESFVENSFDNEDKTNDYVLKTGIPILSDEEYLKLIKRNVAREFYMLQSK